MFPVDEAGTWFVFVNKWGAHFCTKSPRNTDLPVKESRADLMDAPCYFLRAGYGLPLPDMFQAATALSYPTRALISNDKALKRIKEIDVFMLHDIRL